MDTFEPFLANRQEQRREQRIYGVVTAKVTGRMDDGTFELDYLSMGSNAPSAPARMMMPMAGERRGTYFMPEEGDEVVVAFDSGDTNMPIILGAVFNAESPPPDQAKPSADNHVKTIVSRSGHEVTFDDTPGQGQVRVKSANGHAITLDATPPGKVQVQTAGGSGIELSDAGGVVTVTSPGAIALQTGALTVGASSVSFGPPSIPNPPSPEPLQIVSPVQIKLSSALITLEGAAIEFITTGNATTSTVTIDGTPFSLHKHALIPPATTGPVAP